MISSIFSKSRNYFLRTLLCCGAAVSTVASADVDDNPPPLPGWTHATTFAASSRNHGIYLSGGDVSYSSPAVADIDDNPDNGLETAVGGADGMLYVYRADGTLLWSAALPNNGCSKTSNSNKLLSSPAVGKLYGNGANYVVVGYGGIGGKACGGGVMAFKGTDGSVAWHHDLKKFAKGKFGTNLHSVFATPTLGDTDGDGKLEVGVGAFDRNVYLLEHDGRVRWYYNAADTVWASGTFVNVDADPQLELVMPTDISKNNFLKPKTKDGGFVYAFKTKKPKSGQRIGFRSKGAYVWQTFLPQSLYSSPTIADVLPAAGLEIVIGSGCYFPANNKDKVGKWVKILSLKTGKVLQTLNTTACLSSSPAVANLDDDPDLEIVATVNGNSRVGDNDSRIMAWKPNNPNPIWTTIPKERGRNDSNGGTFTSPVIADVDGNGSLEVVVANNSSVGIYNGRDGSPLTCQTNDCPDNPYMLYAGAYIRGTPAIADVNRDGVLDIVVGTARQSGSGNRGVLFGWTNLAGLLSSPAGNNPPYSAPWPMFRGGPARSGIFGQ